MAETTSTKHDLSPEEETDLIEQFNKWYDLAIEGPNNLEHDAHKIADIWEGQQKATRLSKNCCDIDVNLFFRIHQVICSKLADQQQTAEYRPIGDPQKRIVAIMRTEQFRSHWSQYDAQQQWEAATEDAGRLGIGWVKGGYDPAAYCDPKSGKYFPDMVPERVDPDMILLDGACTRLDLKDADYIMHLKNMGKQEIADFTEIPVDEIGDEDWDHHETDDHRWDKSPNEFDQITVAEIWWDCKERDKDGKKVYPYGRKTICTGSRVLVDGPNPFKTNSPKFPFFPIIFIRIPDTVSGVPMGRFILKAQKWFNVLLATVIDSARLTAYIKTFINRAAGIDKNKLHNGPGQFVDYDSEDLNGHPPAFHLPPVAIPEYVSRMLDKILFLIEWIMGYVEVSQGRQPGSVRSGRGIDSLKQEADTGLRVYSRRLSYAVKCYARLFLWVASDMYSGARAVRAYGLGYNRAMKSYKEYKTQLKEEMLQAILEDKLTNDEKKKIDDDKMAWKDKQYVRKLGGDNVEAFFEVFGDSEPFAMDVDIIPDTSSPWSREARNNKGEVLVQNGLPLSLHVKHYADLPNRNDELIADLQELERKKMEMEMMALQAKGQAQGPGGPPPTSDGGISQAQEKIAQTQAGLAGQR
tara:strand:- start:1561 stop:3468 length:1908 start_codon:yes stop_codon:yes gene_type:complete